MYDNLEEPFLKDLENCRIFCGIGAKGTGKSHFMLKFLRYAIYNNLYEKIHCVFPAYSMEQHDSYGFLKTQKQVNIYKEYKEEVAKRSNADRMKGFKTLLIIDDATSFDLDDPTLKLISTTSRHGKSKEKKYGGVCLFMLIHAGRRVLKPAVRFNIDYWFVFNISNRMLLQNLYEELTSMKYDSFNDFLSAFKKVVAVKYNGMVISNQSEKIDPYLSGWNLLKFDEELKPVNIKKPEVKKDNKFSIVKNLYR